MSVFCGRRALSSSTVSHRQTSAAQSNFSFTLLHFLRLSSIRQSLQLTKQSHAQIVSIGFTQNPFLATKLVSAYAVNGCPTESRFVFDSVLDKSVFLWNSLINGLVRNRRYNESVGLINEMCNGGVLPDEFTLATVLKACGENRELMSGTSIHGRSIQLGLVSDTVVSNSLMSVYSSCGQFNETKKLFHEMPERSVSSWNVVISGFANSANSGFDKGLWDIVKRMQIDGFKPDGFTFSCLLPLCATESTGWDYGRELHCYIVKNGLDSGLNADAHRGCCLIDMYSKSNRVTVGRRVFDRIKSKNVYVWTSMINGYVRNGNSDEAFALFREMQAQDGLEPNEVSLLSILPACNSIAGLIGGKQIHGFALRKRLNADTPLCNALIDMYAKCGSLGYARMIFETGLFSRDAISWSTMISGYGSHGKGKEAVILFDQMLRLGNKPDIVTIISVLSACGRSGLTEEGLRIYNLVTTECGINPTTEICACVVDILGRAGKLDEALAFVRKMPVEPGPSVWGSLVSSCVMHGNYKMQELAYRFLLELEPENPSNYISLSNFHASSKRWDTVAELRRTMRQRGMVKTPGCSWINIYGKTHSFYVADKVHPCSESIYKMLDDLVAVMTGVSYSNPSENLV